MSLTMKSFGKKGIRKYWATANIWFGIIGV